MVLKELCDVAGIPNLENSRYYTSYFMKLWKISEGREYCKYEWDNHKCISIFKN